MIDPKKQPIRVKIEFSYDADVFEGDPDDAFDIAELELGEIRESVEHYMFKAVNAELRNFKLLVQPD